MLKSMMIKASLGALLLALASTAGGAAEIKSIAILTPEQGTDFGWNQQGVDAAKAAGEKDRRRGHRRRGPRLWRRPRRPCASWRRTAPAC